MFKVTGYDVVRIMSDYIGKGDYNCRAFERYEDGHDVFEPMFPGWKHVLILGTEYTDVIMVRAYLDGRGAEYAVHMFTYDCRWVIATSYDIPEVVAEYDLTV